MTEEGAPPAPAAPTGGLGARDILKISSRFSATNLSMGAFSAASYILIAKRLGPDGMGLVGLSQLWLLYASFTRSGVMAAASREIMHSLGRGDLAEAERLEGAALAGEAFFLLLTFLAMAGIAAFWPLGPGLRPVLAITAVSFLCNSMLQLIDNLAWAHQRFSLITRANLISKASQPALMLLGVYTTGLSGAIAAPAVASALTLLFYLTAGPKPRAPSEVRWPELRRLLGVGLPLSLLGALYWGFRTSDRVLVAKLLTIGDLGLFSFAMMFIGQGCQWISDFLNVLQSRLFTELGRVGEVRPLAPAIERIGLMILVATCAGAGVAQAGFGPAVALLAPKFRDGIPVFDILSLNLVGICLPLLANTVLVSSVVNKQAPLAALQAGGLAVNVALGYGLTKAGYGLQGIAWSSVAAQLLVAFGAQALLHPDLSNSARKGASARYYGLQAALLALALAQFHLLSRLPHDALSGLPLRLAPVLVLWGSLTVVLFRPRLTPPPAPSEVNLV